MAEHTFVRAPVPRRLRRPHHDGAARCNCAVGALDDPARVGDEAVVILRDGSAIDDLAGDSRGTGPAFPVQDKVGVRGEGPTAVPAWAADGLGEVRALVLREAVLAREGASAERAVPVALPVVFSKAEFGVEDLVAE